jgi:hypothetical protein
LSFFNTPNLSGESKGFFYIPNRAQGAPVSAALPEKGLFYIPNRLHHCLEREGAGEAHHADA